MWRAYKVLPGGTDISAITGDDILHADNKNGQLSDFITVYPNGTLAFYQPNPDNIEPTNLWTNGYYISSPGNGGLVCRMRAFTVSNGARSFSPWNSAPFGFQTTRVRTDLLCISRS